MERRTIVILVIIVSLSLLLYLYIDLTEPCENKHSRCLSDCKRLGSINDIMFCNVACDLQYSDCPGLQESGT